MALTAQVSFNARQLIDVVDPTGDQHAATKLYVDQHVYNVENLTQTGGTLTANSDLVFVNATDGNTTINLPAAASHRGRVFTVKKTDATANTVTIDGKASETIDGATTLVLTAQYETKTIASNGTNWMIITAS